MLAIANVLVLGIEVKMKTSVCEVVRTIELGPLFVADSTSFKFRVEILRRLESGDFFARIYRWEFLRVQPSFPQSNGIISADQADHEILVIDDFIGTQDFSGSTPDNVWQQVEVAINKVFSI